MPLNMHTVEMVDGSNQQNQDRLVVALKTGIANAAGGAAGAAVTTAVTLSQELPTNYGVFVTVDNTVSASVAITGKTANGFNVVLTPNPATATLAAGTFDVLVVA